MSDNHAQFLITGNQLCSLEIVSAEEMFRDVEKIEKNKNIISALLENVDRVKELRLSRNDVNLSSELFLKRVEKCLTIILKVFDSMSKFIYNIFTSTCL